MWNKTQHTICTCYWTPCTKEIVPVCKYKQKQILDCPNQTKNVCEFHCKHARHEIKPVKRTQTVTSELLLSPMKD